MNKTSAFLAAPLVALASVVVLTGCQITAPQSESTPQSQSTPETENSAKPDTDDTESESESESETEAEAEGPAVPGFAYGEIPPVPLFALPDLSLLDASLSGFTLEFTELVGDYPGLTVAAAACDESGERKAGNGSAYLYGDGSGTFTSPDGTIVNYGDGSGTYVIDGVSVTAYGDGSGTYAGPNVSMTNYGDGSGTYSTATSTITIYGDGSGTSTIDGVTNTNYGDGSATYSGNGVTITNYGDGSGLYEGDGLSIVNYGDGTGIVNGTDIKVEPLTDVPALGVFPPMGVLEPITACGTTITLDAGVLFDFNKADIRPDAETTLDSLGRALRDANVPAAEVSGHTDSIGSDDENQTLSEKRADAVVAALTADGADTDLTAVGYGESAPVALNENADGSDNAAGRQLNRRVEIFIPAF